MVVSPFLEAVESELQGLDLILNIVYLFFNIINDVSGEGNFSRRWTPPWVRIWEITRLFHCPFKPLLSGRVNNSLGMQ
jgi:hypothetical protein